MINWCELWAGLENGPGKEKCLGGRVWGTFSASDVSVCSTTELRPFAKG